MQVGQGLAIVQPGDLRHHAFEQAEEACRLGHKGVKPFAPVNSLGFGVLVQELRGTGLGLFGRQVHQRQIVGTLEVGSHLLESGPALFIDQPG